MHSPLLARSSLRVSQNLHLVWHLRNTHQLVCVASADCQMQASLVQPRHAVQSNPSMTCVLRAAADR